MRMNERVGGSAYPEAFNSRRDFLAFHALPLLEEGERRGVLDETGKRALNKIRAERDVR